MYARTREKVGQAAVAATIDVPRAVRLNRQNAQRLGWQAHFDRIVRLLRFIGYTPGEEEFAEAVARWQEGQGLTVDGIIGPKTWARMRGFPGLAPTAVPARSSVTPSRITDWQGFKRKIVNLANQEWLQWGRETIKEDDPSIRSVLGEYWRTGVGRLPRKERWWSTVPWSAAFVSSIMRRAGAGNAFRYSGAHSVYIKAAKDNRLANNDNPFKAYRVNEVVPGVGDIVCKSRAGSGATYENIHPSMKTHCDIVTDVFPNRIVTIGGNVRNSVSKTTVSTNADRFINRPGYFAVIRIGGPAITPLHPMPVSTPSPTATPSAGPPRTPTAATTEPRPCNIEYGVLRGQEYGPVFRSRRPPGLPPTARMTSASGAALPHVERIASAQNLGRIFVATVTQLARAESGGMFARPADNVRRPFNVLDRANPISAWGVFQCNRGFWRSLSGVRPGASPWESTPCDEIEVPLRRYAEIYRQVKRSSGRDVDAARGIRVFHAVTGVYNQSWLPLARNTGFSEAWRRLNELDFQTRRQGALRRGRDPGQVTRRDLSGRIDKHLRQAGVLPGI